MTSLAGLPPFLLYFAVALAFVLVFALIYVQLTPQREVALMRDGNIAATLSFTGALIGFAIPLAKSISQSANILDMAVWSGVALVVQLVSFFLAALVLPGLGRRIATGEVAAGGFAGGTAIGIGLINAACMTY